MAKHRLIQEVHNNSRGTCDLCRHPKPRWHYRGRTPVERNIRDHDQVVDRWTESDWHVCAICSMFIDNGNNRQLLARMNRANQDLHITRRNVRTVASFLEQLQPGREVIA